MEFAAASSDETLDEGVVQQRDPRVGMLVAGRWLIEAVLGSGGMATVYKAVHNRNGRQVALKVLHPELNDKSDFRERFLFEAYIGNKVVHRGVVTALDDGALADGTPYLVLEYLEGESLQALSNRMGQLLSPIEVSWYAEQLLDILETVHASGVIHRDIKPENLFLTRDGALKLLDFGIAKAKVETSQQTQLGITMGTPSFMSPEQARGRWGEVDAQSDLFSVAATMYTLLSGRVPHQAETTNETLLAAMTSEATPIAQVLPHLHPRFAAVIDRGLAFHKRDRFKSATEMKAAVAQARAAMQTPSEYAAVTYGALPLPRVNQKSDADITHPPVVTTEPGREAVSSYRKFILSAAFLVSAAIGFMAVRHTSFEEPSALKPLGVIHATASELPPALEPLSARYESPAQSTPASHAYSPQTAQTAPLRPTTPIEKTTPKAPEHNSAPADSTAIRNHLTLAVPEQTPRQRDPAAQIGRPTALPHGPFKDEPVVHVPVAPPTQSSEAPQELDPLARRR